jgi:hypothetical protein
LLAVGAIILDKSSTLVLILAGIAIIQIWYIWFAIIYARHKIVDFHKYSLGDDYNETGTEKNPTQTALTEHDYVHKRKVRKKIGLKTWRSTRVKLDILSSIFLTIIWLLFALYVLNFFGSTP